MPEAVIVATARTPDRAGQQGLARRRAAPTTSPRTIVKARARQGARSSIRATVEDVIWGCGQPGRRGRATTSPASPRILAGLDDVPGVTVNRYCSSSLQTIRMAAHAIKAGEGDVFIAGGVETVSRFHVRRGRHRPAQPEVRRGRERARKRAPRAASRRGRRRRACPTSTSRWARPPRTCAEVENVDPRGDGRVRGAARSSARSSRRRTASSSGRSRRSRSPDGTVVTQGRRPARRHHGREARRAEAGVPSRRQGHRRQRVPAQRRRRRGDRDERHQGQGARHHAARPHRRQRRVRRSTPRSWASARSRRAARR